MNKQEFLDRLESENLNLGEYILILDKISDVPFAMGSVYDQGIWKVYKTREKGGHYIIKETKDENEAFNLLYELIASRHNRLNNNA